MKQLKRIIKTISISFRPVTEKGLEQSSSLKMALVNTPSRLKQLMTEPFENMF